MKPEDSSATILGVNESIQTSLPVMQGLESTVRPVCQAHGVARLQVFGSLAAGRAASGSDVDLLVEFLPEIKAGLFEMRALKEELEGRIGRRVDLLSRRAVEKSRNAIRRRAILANPVTIYAR